MVTTAAARICLIAPAFLFFVFLLRRPPSSTLFPTRRSSDLKGKHQDAQRLMGERHPEWHLAQHHQSTQADRSEEHTSELQSQSNLVCRLLLEKTKATPQPMAWAFHCRMHSQRLLLVHRTDRN